MPSKNLIAAATLILALGSRAGEPLAALPVPSVAAAQDDAALSTNELEGLLPTPQWVMENLSELGIEEAQLSPIRDRLKEARREHSNLRVRLRDLRQEMRRTLAHEPLDEARVEQLFESILQLENQMKRTQLRARLTFMTHITAPQRARVRTLAKEAPVQRRMLRRRIEEIRTLGRRLKQLSGAETRDLRERLPRIERLIRSGRLREALRDSGSLRDRLREALGLPGAKSDSND